MIETTPAAQEHVCTDACDHTEVKRYVTRAAVERWNARTDGHGPTCHCIVCADLRRYFGREPLPIVIGSRVIPSLDPEDR